MKYAGDKEGVMNGEGATQAAGAGAGSGAGASLQPVHGAATKGDGSNLASD